MRPQITWWTALLCGLVLQSTFLAHFLPDGLRPDFTRTLVLWLAVTGRPAGGVWYAFTSGLLLDYFTGSPLGFGAFLRLGTYGFARPARGVVEHSPLVFVIGPASVAFETLLVWLMKSAAYSHEPDLWPLLWVGLTQAFVEALMVPLIFVVMEMLLGYRTEWGTKFDPR